MDQSANIPQIFDYARRRIARDRAFKRTIGSDNKPSFLLELMANEIADRLTMVRRNFTNALLLGAGCAPLAEALRQEGIICTLADPGAAFAAHMAGETVDEDLLPFAPASFDLAISVGLFDSCNDLPGALVQIRRALRPDGLFLAAMIGGDSLMQLRGILRGADGEYPVARIHPRVDVRTIGDLLQRTGFALPVVDSDRINLRYNSLSNLVADIRDFGGSNILSDRPAHMSRAQFTNARLAFDDARGEDGKVAEIVEVIYLCGWAPHPDQPKPAVRGSASQSLAAALKQ
ncbi:MAG: methyltransferase domain-containing protein [Parasphingorhabdus sp.]|nr:methyltransferase domain-containing protein [Parasphingorhabdus sp.]